MTTWRFSDGTTATLGGNVEGGSLFAQELRADIAAGDLRYRARIPGPGINVDVNDLTTFDAWLRHELSLPYRKGIRLTDAPKDVPPLLVPPGDDDEPEEGVRY